MEKELPKRKHPRSKTFDYSSAGAYYITICTKNRRCLLSHIIGCEFSHDETKENVGRGLAPAENSVIKYTTFGKIAKEQLLTLENRYPYLKVDRFVIMPNHIHAILILNRDSAGASPRPTLMDIVCAYKSLTTLECRKNGLASELFQTSFYDHVIRDKNDYDGIVKYIVENPLKWYYDELYSEK